MDLLDSSDRRSTRSLVVIAVALVASVAAIVRALRRNAASAAEVPLSPLTAGWHVAPDYPERRGVVSEARSASERRGGSDDPRDGAGEVVGEMDDLGAFARPGFDPDAVAPAVRDFYERTADFQLAYGVRWHRPFRVGAALTARATGRLEQLNLPAPGESVLSPDESSVGRLDSRFAPVDPAADPRAGARAWVRTDESGDAVFVAIYGHHERGDTRYVNIAVPLPGANLSTVLRPENLADRGIELTTLGGPGDGDEGLYLATPIGALGLPLDQRFRVWPAETPVSDASDRSDFAVPEPLGEEAGPDGRGPVVATHEMWLFGRQFLTIRYAGRPE